MAHLDVKSPIYIQTSTKLIHCKDVILHNLGRSLHLATFCVGSVKRVNT